MAAMTRSQRVFLALSLGLMLAIFLFSSQPGYESSSVSFWFARWLAKWIGEDGAQFLVRKGAHFTIYALLGFCLLQSFGSRPKSFFWVVAFCVLFAALDEFHQSFVPGRSAQLRDVLLDGCGSATGAAISRFFLKHK